MLQCKSSIHIGEKYSIRHNTRDYDGWNKDGHIDPSRTPLNQILVNHNLKDWFYEIFSDAILEFNAKQDGKHDERKIRIASYYEEQKKKVQEVIIQLGDHDTYMKICEAKGQEQADEFYADALKAAFEKWQVDNPSLRVFHASIHMDEIGGGTPHLHLDFLPIVEATRGLTVKVSFEGALKQLGFRRDPDKKYANTPFKQWIANRRKSFEDFFQKQTDRFFGEGFLTVLKSEHSGKFH